jgi:hypothetical protein
MTKGSGDDGKSGRNNEGGGDSGRRGGDGGWTCAIPVPLVRHKQKELEPVPVESIPDRRIDQGLDKPGNCYYTLTVTYS